MLQADVIMARLRCQGPDKIPVIFTAPHNIGLVRDGMPDHKPEDYTSFLASEFATSSSGGFLVWSKREIERSKRWFLEHGGTVDPSNRDPNYLTLKDLEDPSPWHATLGSLHARCQEVIDATLHMVEVENSELSPIRGGAAIAPRKMKASSDTTCEAFEEGVSADRSATEPVMPPCGSVVTSRCLRRSVNFDIHGCAGSAVDLYVGLGAMARADYEMGNGIPPTGGASDVAVGSHLRPPRKQAAENFRSFLAVRLGNLLCPLGFVVDTSSTHKFQGAWRTPPAPFPKPREGCVDAENASSNGNGSNTGPVGTLGELSGGTTALEEPVALNQAAASPPSQEPGAVASAAPLASVHACPRFTVSQQALKLGFALACQLEFSRKLRKRLNADKQLREDLAGALVAAAADAMIGGDGGD